HREITMVESGKDKGKLGVTTDWVDSKGDVLLKEETTFEFAGTGNKRTIDRITKLTAQDKPVSFTDNKEGMLGMRMARQLEHPSEKAEKFTDANGIPTDVPTLNNEGVTGMYRGSNGLTGNDVWGTRGEWMNLSGTIEGENISVAIFDHPDNVGYPTYWHARGYGLYAANTLGQKALSEGKEELNFMLDAGESVTFKYRIVVYSNEEVNDEVLNKEAKAFGGV
ncbi:MAG TPA: PmoA family protein, partial [Cyclobacteriaceae bacterium]|nr:PmoA family protein [Cyclobacteriaceae bacterium]